MTSHYSQSGDALSLELDRGDNLADLAPDISARREGEIADVDSGAALDPELPVPGPRLEGLAIRPRRTDPADGILDFAADDGGAPGKTRSAVSE
jgi:hypothetical protein